MKKFNELIIKIQESFGAKEGSDYHTIHDSNGVEVHDVRTHEGMMKLGKGTEWEGSGNTPHDKQKFEDNIGISKYNNVIAKGTADPSTGYHGDSVRDYYGDSHYEPKDEQKENVVHLKNAQGGTDKYKFHHDGEYYVDKDNNEVDPHNLVKKHPELKNVKEFKGQHPAFGN